MRGTFLFQWCSKFYAEAKAWKIHHLFTRTDIQHILKMFVLDMQQRTSEGVTCVVFHVIFRLLVNIDAFVGVCPAPSFDSI